MKKIIAIILCFMMLPLNFALPAFAEENTALKPIFVDTFDGTSGEYVGGKWSNGSTSVANLNYVYDKDPVDDKNSVFKMERINGDTGRAKMRISLKALNNNKYVNEDMVIKFRYYHSTGKAQIVVRDYDGDSEGTGVATVNLYSLEDIEQGKWCDIKLEMKVSSDNKFVINGYVTVDGDTTQFLAGTEQTFKKGAEGGLSEIDFESRYKNSGTTTDYLGNEYFDDFGVYLDYSNELKSAADELTFDKISNEQLIDEVRDNLSLVNEITYNNVAYPVSWESSDENVIKTDGTVSRKSFTNTATLTAKISMPEDAALYVKKDFNITVLKSDSQYTDEEILSEYIGIYVKEKLFTDEEPDAITKDLLPLPSQGAEGMTFGEWSSSNPDVIASDGTVTRPEFGEGDAEVTLTAAISMNGSSVPVTLTYTVLEKADPYIDINATMENLTYNSLTDEDSGAVRSDLTLPTKGEGDSVISWSSSNPDAISESGTVTRGTTKQEVTLTATISSGSGARDSKEFTFTVLPTREKMLEADMAEINLGDNPQVSESFDLPLTGSEYGTQFTWESDSVYLRIDGSRAIVYRPPFDSGDAEVNLSLTAICDGTESSFNYTLTVIREATDEQIVDGVMAVLDFSQISLEAEDSVTENLALITKSGGVDISWSTDGYEDFVSETGEIFRPIPGEGAETVTITATFTRGYIEKTKDYTFTVTPFENDSQVLEKAKEALLFSTLSSEDIKAVTQNLTLPSTGKYGAEISWSSDSSNLKIEGETGVVSRPAWGKTNASVTLVATITYEGLTDTKTFNVEILEKNYMEVEQDVWSEDFESWTSDNMYNTTNATWTRPAETEAVLSLATDPKDENNNVLKIDRTGSSGTGYVIAAASKAQSGIVYMGLKVYLEEGGSIRVNGRTDDCDQVPVSISSSGVTATGHPLPDAEVNINGWNTLDLIIDVNNERYQVVFNGVPYTMADESEDGSDDEENSTGDGFPFQYYGQGRNTTIKSFRMNFANNKVCYIDDLYMENKILYTDVQLNLAEAWEKEFLSKNDISAVTQTLVFPDVWADGVRVFYYTSDSNVLDRAGMIQLATGEADVTFKVGFNDGFTEYFKSYKIHVIKTEKVQLTDEEAVNADLEAAVATIKGSGMLTSLTGNLTIPTTGENGSTITAVSSDTSVLTNSGAVTRGNSDKSVTLTVTAKKNGVTSEPVILNITVAKKASQSSTTSSSSGSGGGIKVNYGEPTKPNSGIEITQPDEDNQSKTGFNDLTASHWAYSELMYMVDNKIMNGTGDGNIQPERTIKREEFIKMLVIAMGLDLSDETAQFTDVSESDWYAPYIATAKNAGLVNGYSDGRAGIGENITREDMAVMIYRAAELAESGADNLFGDDEVISSYAKSAVYSLKDLGVINGKDNGNFAPKATATRAETACMLYRAINKDLFN